MQDKRISRERIMAQIEASARTISGLMDSIAVIEHIGSTILDTFESGGKVLTAGNGGSAAEALHMSEELIGRFLGDRKALPSVALVADPTVLTCIGNDYGFDCVFSRQIEGLACEGDLLVLFSTSGKARNLELALDAARAKNVKVVSLLGRDGGELAGKADIELIVKGTETARIQEVHQLLLHILLDIVEQEWGEK